MAQEKKRGEVEIDLLQLMKALWRSAWLIVLVTLVAAAAGWYNAQAGFVPQYTADVKFTINTDMTGVRDGDFISSEELSAANELVSVYKALLKTRAAQQAVAEEAGFDRDPSALGGMVSSVAVESTQLLRVSVTSPDPEEAKRVADAIAAVYPSLAAEVIDGSTIRLVDAAQLPTTASAPPTRRGMVGGAMLGLVVSCAVVVILALLDDKIREKAYLTSAFPTVPVLGSVPGRDAKPGKGYSVVEAYTLLGANVLSALDGVQGCRVFAVAGPLYDEGCDRLTLRLGKTLAGRGGKTLMIDADLACPAVAEALGLAQGPGLAEVLAGAAPAESALTAVEGTAGLYAMGAGTAGPGMRLDGSALAELMEALRQKFDCIVLRLPPLGVSADAMTAAAVTDGMLMTVRLGTTARRALAQGMELASLRHVRVLGFALTAGKSK